MTVYNTLTTLMQRLEITYELIEYQKDLIAHMETEYDYNNSYSLSEIADEKEALESLFKQAAELEQQESQTEDCYLICKPAHQLKLPTNWSYI